MKRKEYLKNAFEKYNEGKISAEAYDCILENINAFCEEDEENDTAIVIRKGKNAYPILGKCTDFNILVENLDDDDLQYIENTLQQYGAEAHRDFGKYENFINFLISTLFTVDFIDI